MRQLNSLLEAQPGQKIRFLYRGGSTPYTPGYRNVVVDRVEDGRLHGIDQDQPEDDNYRQYRPHNAQSIWVVEEAPAPTPVAAEAACDCESPCLPEIPADLADDPGVRDMMRMLGIGPRDEGPMEETRVSFVEARQQIVDAVNACESEDLACYYRNIVVKLRESDVVFDEDTGELIVRQPERKVLCEIDARIGDDVLHLEFDNRGGKTASRNGEPLPEAEVPEAIEDMTRSIVL